MLNFLTPDTGVRGTRALMTTAHGGCSVETCFGGNGITGGGLNLGMKSDDPVDHVRNNRALVSGLAGRPVQWLNQVHGNRVVTVTGSALLDVPPQADAAITGSTEIALAVQTADCLPVLFAAPGIVGAAHAGWRGLAAGVLDQTVQAMASAGAPVGEIRAWLGPGIGPRCFEVGPDVHDAFCDRYPLDQRFFAGTGRPGKWLADLAGLARARLLRCGLAGHHVTGGHYCTMSDGRFFSYRRAPRCGRMAAVIWRAHQATARS